MNNDYNDEYSDKDNSPITYAGEFNGDYDEDYQAQVLEQIRLAKIRRARADQLARDRMHATILMITAAVLALIIFISIIVHVGKKKTESKQFDPVPSADLENREDLHDLKEPIDNDSHKSDTNALFPGQAEGHELVQVNGITYIDGILIVNKTFSLPSDYAPQILPEAQTAFDQMAAAAWGDGLSLWICSGYRSYAQQEQLFESYAAERGLNEADAVSARPGHSEHQSGLCMDVNSTDFSFGDTAEAAWLEQHCAEYGFIIRFPKGKENITGYEYEPWHIRYVGKEHAQAIKANGLCLEEYLNVSSNYEDSPDNETFLEKYAAYASIVPQDSSAPDAGQDAYAEQPQDTTGQDNYTDYNNGQDTYTDYNTDYGYDDGYNNYDYNYGYDTYY